MLELTCHIHNPFFVEMEFYIPREFWLIQVMKILSEIHQHAISQYESEIHMYFVKKMCGLWEKKDHRNLGFCEIYSKLFFL
jgi:hypothetical protein